MKLSSADHRVAFRHQPVAQMRPDESGGARNDNAQNPSTLFILTDRPKLHMLPS